MNARPKVAMLDSRQAAGVRCERAQPDARLVDPPHTRQLAVRKQSNERIAFEHVRTAADLVPALRCFQQAERLVSRARLGRFNQRCRNGDRLLAGWITSRGDV